MYIDNRENVCMSNEQEPELELDPARDARVTDALASLGTVEPPAAYVGQVLWRIKGQTTRGQGMRGTTRRRGKGLGMAKKILIGLAGIAAAGLLVAYINGGLPSSGAGTEGTIGAAQRYQAEQIKKSDVATGNAELQAFIQTEAFDALIHDKRAMDALASPALQQALASPAVAAALASPALRQALGAPAGQQALAGPAIAQGLAAPGVQQAVASPAVQAALSAQGVQAALTNADLAKILASPALAQAFASQAFQQALASPAFQQALASPSLAQALAAPGFQQALASPAFQSALASPGFQAALANPQFAQSLAAQGFVAQLWAQASAAANLVSSEALRER